MSAFGERLEQMKRELQEQNEEWDRAKTAMGSLHEALVAVPRGFFEEIDEASQPHTQGCAVVTAGVIRG